MTAIRLTRPQARALADAIRDGAVCHHSAWTVSTASLEALARRGLLARVPDAEAGISVAWYRPTAAGRAALAGRTA